MTCQEMENGTLKVIMSSNDKVKKTSQKCKYVDFMDENDVDEASHR